MRTEWVSETPNEFGKFLEYSKQGDRCIYHRGIIASDRARSLRNRVIMHRTVQEREWINQMADLALVAADAGLVVLTQKRHGVDDYDYIAVRTAEPARFRTPMYDPIIQIGA